MPITNLILTDNFNLYYECMVNSADQQFQCQREYSKIANSSYVSKQTFSSPPLWLGIFLGMFVSFLCIHGKLISLTHIIQQLMQKHLTFLGMRLFTSSTVYWFPRGLSLQYATVFMGKQFPNFTYADVFMWHRRLKLPFQLREKISCKHFNIYLFIERYPVING